MQRRSDRAHQFILLEPMGVISIGRGRTIAAVPYFQPTQQTPRMLLFAWRDWRQCQSIAVGTDACAFPTLFFA